MVDIEQDLEFRRFPWTYKKEYDKENNFIGFRVRIDYIIVTNSDDPYKFDMYHFTSLSDRLDNAQLAVDCGLEVSFGHEYILVTPHRFSHIYKQIFEHDNICALPLTI